MAEEEAEKAKRACPVCDELVPSDAKVCPSCNTDLSLFADDDMEVVPEDAEALKDQLMAEGNGHLTDLLKVADEGAPVQETPAVEEEFECPECNGAVPADAVSCPHCGVEFEMEEVFECPMCSSLIDVTVDKCPSCGAEFEDAEAEEPADISAQIVDEAPVEEKAPEPEKPPEPVSFADRLKQVKDTPDAEPGKEPEKETKELSFAERMKAMKGDGVEEPAPAAPQEPKKAEPEKEPVPQPAQEPKKVEPEKEPAPQPAQEPKKAEPAPEPEKEPAPAGKPKEGEQSFSERMKAIKQAAKSPAKAEPEQPAEPSAPKPAEAPTVSKPRPDSEATKKEGYKELPRHIGEVKKLLVLANKMKIDVSASKSLINQAVSAGKKRDLENAIRLVKQGKAGLERDIRTAMVTKLRTYQNAIALEKRSGMDVVPLERQISEVKGSTEAGDFQTAYDDMNNIESQMSSAASATLPKAELEIIGKTLDDARALQVNVDEAQSLYDEANKAMGQDDKARASEMAKKATDNLSKILPGYIASEMRKAKVTLREIKMMNVDITKPVEILKEANDFVREGDYCEALSSIKVFKDFVDGAQ